MGTFSTIRNAFGILFVCSLSFALLPRNEKPFASATLQAKGGSRVKGTVELSKKTDRLLVHVNVWDIAPGTHAIHVHEKGDCSGKDAAAAGEHFNPEGKKHGAPSSAERHAGDFGNIDIPKEGRAELTLEVVSPPRVNEMVDWEEYIGKSIVIHKGEDDFQSQPAGNSGDRIACGVIRTMKTVSE